MTDKHELDTVDIEEQFLGKKRTRVTCYEKSCIRKPIIDMTFKLGDREWTEKYCEEHAKDVEVFGWTPL